MVLKNLILTTPFTKQIVGYENMIFANLEHTDGNKDVSNLKVILVSATLTFEIFTNI
ncbi:MAG: hypothetical protein ACJAZP_000181 [Psychromonas sp.]|jgi:hypothetical protein